MLFPCALNYTDNECCFIPGWQDLEEHHGQDCVRHQSAAGHQSAKHAGETKILFLIFFIFKHFCHFLLFANVWEGSLYNSAHNWVVSSECIMVYVIVIILPAQTWTSLKNINKNISMSRMDLRPSLGLWWWHFTARNWENWAPTKNLQHPATSRNQFYLSLLLYWRRSMKKFLLPFAPNKYCGLVKLSIQNLFGAKTRYLVALL